MKRFLLSLLLLLGLVGTAAAQSDVVVFNSNPDMVYEDGETMSFTIIVTNNGPNPATNVHISFPIPADIVIPPGIIKFWWSGSNGSGAVNGAVNNTIPSLAVNQTVTYTINIKIPKEYTSVINPPVVTWAQFADIQVTTTDGQTTYTPGQTAVYTVTVLNAGPATPQTVSFNFPLPAGTTSMNWTSSQGGSGTGAIVNNIISQLAPGQSVVYTASVVVPPAFTGNLTAAPAYTLSGGITDPSPSCGCTDIDTQAPPASIVVETTDGVNNFIPGYPLTYTVTVTNNGQGDAADLNITSDLLASGFTNFTWSGNGATGTDANLNNTIALLPAGASITYTITAQVPDTYAETTLTVSAAATTTGTYPINCTACTDTDTLAPTGGLVVNLTNNEQYYTPGGPHSTVYSLTIENTNPVDDDDDDTNDGLGDAFNAAVNFAFEIGDDVPFTWTSSNGTSGTSTPGLVTLLETIPVIPAGSTVTYTITTEEWPATALTQPLTVSATVEAFEFDADPNDGVDPAAFDVVCVSCQDTDIPEYADIVVTNTDGQANYEPGLTATYTVTVENLGPADAQNFELEYTVPAGITYTWSVNGSAPAPGPITTNLPGGVLVSGAILEYTITFDVPADYTGNLVTEATVTTDTADATPGCDACTDTDLPPSANVGITKTLNTGTTYTPGMDMVYTITVTNQGPSIANNIAVQDLIPAGFDPLTASWYGTNGSNGTGNLVNTITSLAAGATVTYHVTIPLASNYDAVDNVVNTATATPETADPNPANNTATHTATPNPQANLVTVKDDYQSEYISATTTQYTITVTNPGPSDAYNVVVNDPKPYYITFMTWEGNDTGGSGTLNNTIPVLVAGETMTYTVTLTIPEDYHSFVGSLTNTVTVTSDTPDPVPGCTTCTDTDTAAPLFVRTSSNQYTVEELVKDVLIDVNCVGIDNVDWSTGTNYGQQNGIAYFNANNSTFPIQEGVVLTCGNAVPSVPGANDGVDGPNPNILSNNPGWNGDAELQNYIAGVNNDASWIKFNFTPVSDTFSFDYLFASEEYGTPAFECTFTDVFAFILTDLTDNTSQNLAVLPGTNTTVGVTTVHLGGPGCAPANVQYFGQYNNNAAAATAPINFNGQTIVMTASATVVPNHPYSIKLVIANGGDHQLNSAVFIEAGSFDIGQPTLPGDITFENQALLLCYGDTYDLEATVTNEDMLVKWQKDGEWIMEDDGVTFVDDYTIPVTEPGTYTVMGYFESNPDCFLEDDIVIDFYPEILPADPQTLYVCDDDPEVDDETWDLSLNTPVILSAFSEPEYYYVSYYSSMEAIETGDVQIWPETNFNPPGNETCFTIYAMIQDTESLCYVVREFEICKHLEPVAGEPSNMPVCDLENDGVAVFDLTTQETAIYAGQDPNVFGVMYFTTEEGANDIESTDNPDQILTPEAFESAGQTIYVRLYNLNAPCWDVAEFDLIVTPMPVIEPVDDVEACDSYVLPALSEGGYYSQPNGVAPITNTTLTASQTVYIYEVEGFFPNICTAEESFEVTIYESPEVAEPVDVAVCDSYMLPALTVGQYYTGPGGTGDVVAAETEITTTTTLYIYAATGNGNDVVCSDEHSFTITVNYAPVVNPATPSEECDDNNDGYFYFDLTDAGAEVIGNQTGLEVTYHMTYDDAVFGDNDITDPTAYQNPGDEDPDDTIYPQAFIRVIGANTTTNCATIVPVDLIVHPRPEIPSLPDYVLCDDNNSPDGVEDFDLTSYNDEATADPNATVTWYATGGDATAGVGPVADDTAYPSGNGEVWVRVENEFGCVSVAPLLLVVNPLPVVAQNMEPFYACEEEPDQGEFDFDEIAPVVTQGAAGYSVAFYDSVQGATDAGDNYLTSPYLSPNATIYARVEDVVTGCFIIAPVTLEVLPAPIAPQPAALEECDPNTDGFAIFDLTGTISGIEAALGGTVTVTVHETANDALFGTNPVPNVSNYENINEDLQVLHLRVSSSQTECFDTVTLTLIVNPAPEAITPADPYVLCDNGTSDTDGVAIFNLTDYAQEVLGTMDPALFSVSYHESDTAADAGFPVIATPASYPGQSGPVYIRVTNNATGCYDVVELELIVNPLPEANQPEPYNLCDGPEGDEIEEFDLTTTIPFITGGVNGVTVTFYQEYADAVGQVNAIANPETYQNITSPGVETIFVRVTDNETGCYRIVLQDIRVEPLPVLLMPSVEATTGCDTDGDGIATFNLDDLVEDMVNNGVGISVAFYESEYDAAHGFNAIPNTGSYDNINPFLQTIYVVATGTETGCQSTPYALTLIVNPAPETIELEDITQCDDQDNDGQDNHAWFDLTVYEDYIYEVTEAAPGTLTIHYFDDEDYANAGQPRITTPAHYNGEDDEIIWVRVEVTGTECFTVASFQLHLNRPWLLNRPTMLVQCNESLNEQGQNDNTFTTFDLTVKEAEILGPMGIGVGNVVSYYTSQQNAIDGTSPITPPTAFENTVNPQTLFVKVTTPDGCVSYTTLTVKVLPLPTPNTEPDALELCDENATGDGVESFDLTLAEDNIGDNDFTVTFTYYPTEADAYAEPPTNEITQPETYVSGTGSVWVRVSANTNNASDPVCYQVVELPLIVHPLPAQGTIAPYAICEQNTDGFAQFDFNTHMDEILGPDVAPADYDDYTVSFSYNGQPVPYIYTNVVQGSQTIDVNVVYEPTECETDVQLTLLVEEQAIAYDVTTPDFDVCDTDGTNDGTTTVDLTQADADIIGTQNPAIHAVSYYETEADAIAGTNAIANPAAFDATTQTIWARIVNTSTVSGCPDFTSFEVVIELLPEPEITTAGDNHTICVDFATGDVIRPLLLQSGVTPNGHTYDWYLDGALVESNQNGTYLAVAPGTYTVEVTGPAPNNCVSDLSQGFEVLQSGPPSAIGEGFVVSNAFGDEQTITVLVEGYGEYQYSLYPEGPWQNSNVFTNVSPGEHYVYIRDVSTADPCTDEGYHLPAVVSVINYPHYFTPNGDGYNDTWNIIGLQAEGYQAIIYIFDRYGKLLKQISPDGEGWDGTFNGNPVPADDYWFTVEFNEGDNRRTFKAHFAVKR